MTYRVKNWEKFQHYRDRNPPWIRFYVEVLDDYKADGAENDFHALPDDAKLTMVLIWALASRYGGVLPRVDSAWLSVKLGIKNVAVAPLIHGGFLIPFSDASKDASTDASAGARPSTSTSTSTSSETEGDARGITEPEPPSPPPPAPDATPAPAVPPTAPANAQHATDTPPEPETPPKANPSASTPPTAAVRYDSLPDWLRSSPGMSPGIWAAWIDTRRRKRAAVCGSAIELCLRKLSERQEQSGAYLALAVERGWIGVTWDWFDNANSQQSGLGRARGQKTLDAQEVTPEVAAAQRNRRAVASVIMGAAKAVGRRLSDAEIKRLISHRCASLPADDIRSGIAQAVNSVEWRAVRQYAEATE